MSTVVHIKAPPAVTVQVKGEGRYHVIVPVPKPVVVEVKGLFASTFIDSISTVDLSLIYQTSKL